ncbi:HlyD family secretion protein [Tenacibaculum maritimum]|uniref:HlyD family secretion protein n=1 Tax=Tenacibaculum maritimum TaxID=107401 RepID=UPI0004054F68|nr:HlyD family efflux transporter periplasmic adaptor subunit [Tenacibaculum maritimum]
MKIDKIEANSEQIREILEKQPNVFLKWGITVIFIAIFLMFLTTWFIKYPDIITSKVLITTQIPPQKEYAKSTGKLDAILISDNDLVKENQPLAIIENTSNYQDVFKLKTIIDTIKVNNQSFSFPIDNVPILFLGDIDSQFAIFENNYIQYQLNKKLKPFSNEAIANRHSISELNRRLQNAVSQKKINKNELSFKEKDVIRSKTLFDKGVISAQDYENKQLEFAQAERNYKNFESSISQIREAISNARQTSKGTEINKIKEEMRLLKGVIQSFNQLKNAIRDWENRFVLASRVDGTVSFLNVWSANQTVNQGDLVFTIIPKENSSYIAKLKTPAQNSGKIKIGQGVNIKLQNYPDTEFGVLKGTVKKISLIPNEEGNYFIDVKLPQKLITSYHKEIEFKQEMLGSAEIITEDLRLIERFFYQLKQIFEQ